MERSVTRSKSSRLKERTQTHTSGVSVSERGRAGSGSGSQLSPLWSAASAAAAAQKSQPSNMMKAVCSHLVRSLFTPTGYYGRVLWCVCVWSAHVHGRQLDSGHVPLSFITLLAQLVPRYVLHAMSVIKTD